MKFQGYSQSKSRLNFRFLVLTNAESEIPLGKNNEIVFIVLKSKESFI